MFALGILAIIQAVFLPGYLAVRILGLADGLLRTLVLSLALSVLFNHFLVWALVTAGAFTPAVMYTVIGAESLLLIGLHLKNIRTLRWPPWREDARRLSAFITDLRARPAPTAILGHTAVALGILTILNQIRLSIAASTIVFDHWDAIVSWNRWALDWHAGNFPSLTWHYPQLLPSLYALSYTILGTADIQFFAKAIAACFPLALFLAMFDLGLRLRDLRILLAMPLAMWLMHCTAGRITIGYADEPVAALTFIAITCIFLAAAGPREHLRRLLIVGALTAAAAALTKQAGWLIAIVYPILAWIIALRGRLSPRAQAATVGILIITSVSLAAPWYIYIRSLGTQGSEFEYILHVIHGERTLSERAMRGISYLATIMQVPVWVLLYIVPALLALSLLAKHWRWITLLAVIPLITAWAIYMNYDLRNVAGAVPAGSIAIIVGAAAIPAGYRRLIDWWQPRVRRPWLAYTLVLITAAGAVAWLTTTEFRASRLLRKQHEQQWQIINAELNAALREHARQHGFTGRILTNYQPLGFLPEFRELYSKNPLSNRDFTLRGMAPEDVHYVIYHGFPATTPLLQQLESEGLLTRIKTGRAFTIYIISGRTTIPG